MCGIVGFTGAGDARERVLRAMADSIVHRGPDGEGYHVGAGIALGMRRLAVIDPQGGRQPVWNETNTIATVYNGEIYNYPELREQLEKQGHVFSTRCDTEVLVHLYEQYGPDFVGRLNGMFAFALWDSTTRTLLLARDHAGIKPLYYTTVAGELWFASEIKALLAAGVVRRELNLAPLDDFFHSQYIAGEESALRGVRRLMPGCQLLWRAGTATVSRWWQLSYEVKPHYTLAGFAAQLARAVRRQMVADVPVGVFLSGGVDSSGVAALMAQAGASPLKTFSVGFAGDAGATAELPFARQVAKHLGTDHHEIMVSDADLAELLPDLVWMLDEPNADYAAVPTYLLARAARSHITVALTGEGGDEVFGGYERYLDPPRANEPYRGLTSIFSEVDKRMLLTGDFHAAITLARGGYLERLDLAQRRHDPVTRCLATDFAGWLPDDLLMKVDRATMAVSLEARVPLLDRKIVEYAAGLPVALKVNGRETKIALKKALDPLLPWEILQRKKMGFTAPLAKWLARPSFRAWLRELLLAARTRQRGFYTVPALTEMLDRPDLVMSDAVKLWLLACFEIWCRQFIDGDRRA